MRVGATFVAVVTVVVVMVVVVVVVVVGPVRSVARSKRGLLPVQSSSIPIPLGRRPTFLLLRVVAVFFETVVVGASSLSLIGSTGFASASGRALGRTWDSVCVPPDPTQITCGGTRALGAGWE